MSAIFGLLLLMVPGCLGVDLVLQPGAIGPDVVATVVNMIRSNCILSEDKLFLRRLAYVETQDGSIPNIDGGIWRVTRDMLTATQSNHSTVLLPLYVIIQNSLHIDWSAVQWSDLRKPLYSGLAAALYLTLQTNGKPSNIPLKIEEQATYWRDHYHVGGSPFNYTAVAEELELGCHSSYRQVDLVFLVDSSSSLSANDFERIKIFLRDTVNGFNVGHDTVHVAIITYASIVTVQFPLNRYYSNVDVNNAIDKLHYTSGSTNTAKALNAAVLEVFSTAKGGRSNAVKVAILITDGRSDDIISTKNAATVAKDHGIAMYTVGVGHKIDSNEINEIVTNPKCIHAFSADGFDSIANLRQEIQNSVCRAPLYANGTVTCEVDKCPPYAFPFTGGNGITIQGSLTCGSANLYGDINNFYPSTAHNLFAEVIGRSGIAHFQAKPDPAAQFLYVSIQDVLGSSKGCNLTMTPLVGDKTINGVDVICREKPSGNERQCQKADLIQFRPLICNGAPVLNNPCSATDAQKGTKYQYNLDNTQYIQCLPTGVFSVVHCPNGLAFDPRCQVCFGVSAPLVDCSKPYQLGNPCTAENLQQDKFYFAYPGDHTKYLQCDIWGKPYVRECTPAGAVWVDEHLTCETPGTHYNPCPQMLITGQRFYAYPNHIYQFIECVDPLNPQVLNCSANQIWDDCDKTCVPANSLRCGSHGTPRPYNPSFLANHVTQAAAQQTTYIPIGAIGPQFTYPCTRTNLGNDMLYFPVQGNRTEFIQCALTGFGYVRTCPSDDPYYDPNSKTCVDGPLLIDGILG